MLAKWTPFSNGTESTNAVAPTLNDLSTLLNDSLFADFAGPAPWARPATAMQLPHTDIAESETELRLQVDLPGHDPKSIQVKVEGDTLTIQSERKSDKQINHTNYLRTERRYGAFARSFILPASVDGARCQAIYEQGVLTVSVPKREEAKPRVIDVQVKS